MLSFEGDIMKVYDSDIRRLLFDSFCLKEEYMMLDDTIVVNEMDICAGLSRADIVVINGELNGYEIKSQRDNLNRLPAQIEYYNAIFDTMTIVAYSSHVNKVLEIVPEWWAINSVVEDNGSLKLVQVRDGTYNHETNILNITMLLWRDEMIELLLSTNDISIGLGGKTRKQLSSILVNTIAHATLAEHVRRILKSRQEWKAVLIQRLNDDLHNM